MKKIYSTLLLSLFVFTAHAQTLVNQEWFKTAGHPSLAFKYFTATNNSSNNSMYLVGNTLSSLQAENFLIAKLDRSTGNPSWVQQYNSISDLRDFGVDIVAKGEYVYVTGFSWDSAANTASITTLKMADSTGTVIWKKTYQSTYGGFNIPARILSDNDGNVYVLGTEQLSSTDFGMVVLKYDDNGSDVWNVSYDSTGLVDGGVSLILDSLEKTVSVTGYSGAVAQSWDFTTFKIKNSTGQITHSTRTANGTGSFSQPVGISKDDMGNLCIAGTAANPTTNHSQIKLISYDSLMNVNYLSTYGDSTLATEAVAMQNDLNGGEVTLGTRTTATGKKEIVLTRHEHGTGVLLWDRSIAADVSGEDAVAGGLSVDYGTTTNIYLTGYTGNATHQTMLTAAYDNSGTLLWLKKFNQSATSNDKGSSIEVDDNGNVYATAQSKDGDSTRYVTVKYASLEHPISFTTDGNGTPVYAKNRILVKFDRSALHEEILNNRDLAFIAPSELLTSTAYNRIKNAVPFDLDNSLLIRLTALTPKDTISISRLGVQVPIPPLWAAFALDYPSIVDRTEVDVSTSLDSLFPMVVYSHPDYTTRLDQNANDSLYNQQLSLHHVSGADTSDINIEHAWDYTRGESFVKVGVIDDGMQYYHQDLGGNNSKVKGGADWTNGGGGTPVNYFNSPNQNVTQHGTQVAGIIAGLSNNTKGIAGIAGGDGTAGNTGAELYVFKIIPGGSDTFGLVSHAYQAIVDNASFDSTHPNNLFWGVHIMNNSWGLSYTTAFKDSSVELLEEAVHYANRNHVTFVASRGNDSTKDDRHYPATFWDDWVLSVGASGRDGTPASQSNTGGCYSKTYIIPAIGRGMDIIAPSDACHIRTAIFNGPYGAFSGTSASAPHASGVAALLMSHHNKPYNDFDNLLPEDVEGLIQATATYGVGGLAPNNNWGWGRLNAGEAMRFAWKPRHYIQHFCGTGVDTISLVTANMNGRLTRRVQNNQAQYFNAGSYIIDMYEVTKESSFFTTNQHRIKTVWAAPSLSSTYIGGLFGGTDLNPIEAVACCESVTNGNGSTSKFYSGNIFHLRDTITGKSVGWLPYDTAYARSYARMCISVLFYDETISSTHELNNATLGIDILLYPNPSTNYNTLLIDINEPAELIVELYDVTGRLVRTVWGGEAGIGNHKIEHNVEDLASGLYVYRINTGKASYAKRFVKQ